MTEFNSYTTVFSSAAGMPTDQEEDRSIDRSIHHQKPATFNTEDSISHTHTKGVRIADTPYYGKAQRIPFDQKKRNNLT